MNKNHYKIIYRLLNFWFCYIVLIILSSYLPHWENVKFFTYFNYIFIFWILLFTITIALKDPHNKPIFINLSILYFFNSLSYFIIFIGDDYLYGNMQLAYLLYQYSFIISSFIFNFCILFILIKLIFSKIKTWKQYLLTAGILMIISCLIHLPHITSQINSIELHNKLVSNLFKNTFQLNILSLLGIIFYGIYVYLENIHLGEYINLLMASLFISTITNIIYNLSMIYHFNIYDLWLYILNSNAIFISVLLYKKMVYTYSDFGQFYESLLARQYKTGRVKIIPRNQSYNNLALKVLRIYIYQRRYYLLSLLILLGIGIFFFELPAFFTFNLVALILGFSIIVIFYDALYTKRGQQKLYL